MIVRESHLYNPTVILNSAKEAFSVDSRPNMGPSFILPSGEFLNISMSDIEKYWNGNPVSYPFHGVVDDYLAFNKKVIDYADDGYRFCELTNSIKVNSGSNDTIYIALNSVAPTSEQYKSILKWLDFIYNIKDYVDVYEGVAVSGKNYVRYYFNEYIPDDILKRIERFYSSGTLYEYNHNCNKGDSIKMSLKKDNKNEAYLVKQDNNLIDSDDESTFTAAYYDRDFLVTDPMSGNYCECEECGWFGDKDELDKGKCPDCGGKDIVKESKSIVESKDKNLKETMGPVYIGMKDVDKNKFPLLHNALDLDAVSLVIYDNKNCYNEKFDIDTLQEEGISIDKLLKEIHKLCKEFNWVFWFDKNYVESLNESLDKEINYMTSVNVPASLHSRFNDVFEFEEELQDANREDYLNIINKYCRYGKFSLFEENKKFCKFKTNDGYYLVIIDNAGSDDLAKPKNIFVTLRSGMRASLSDYTQNSSGNEAQEFKRAINAAKNTEYFPLVKKYIYSKTTPTLFKRNAKKTIFKITDPYDNIAYLNIIEPEDIDESIKEDTVKKRNGKWVNRGDDGEEHGEFKTKKAADAQRKAMYANGYKVK